MCSVLSVIFLLQLATGIRATVLKTQGNIVYRVATGRDIPYAASFLANSMYSENIPNGQRKELGTDARLLFYYVAS